MFSKYLAAGALALSLTAAPALAQDVDTAQVSTSVEAAQSAGLAETITSAEAVTVFVPTNDALAALPQDQLSGVTGDAEKLKSVISYHAIPQAVSAQQAMDMTKDGEVEVETLGGGKLTLMTQDGKVMIKGAGGGTATVVTPDVKVGNVTLHIIDGAILPSM